MLRSLVGSEMCIRDRNHSIRTDGNPVFGAYRFIRISGGNFGNINDDPARTQFIFSLRPIAHGSFVLLALFLPLCDRWDSLGAFDELSHFCVHDSGRSCSIHPLLPFGPQWRISFQCTNCAKAGYPKKRLLLKHKSPRLEGICIISGERELFLS